ATIAAQTFQLYSVIKMPVVSPVVPIMVPADRSNSPPIISIATATAMMTKFDAVKIQVLAPLGFENASVVTVKKTKITIAPASAPTSGLRRILLRRCDELSRSSSSGGVSGAAAGSSVMVVMSAPSVPAQLATRETPTEQGLPAPLR